MIIRTIRQIIDGRDLHTVSPQASVRQACVKLAKFDIGALAVVKDSALLGVLSERDIIHRAIVSGMPLDDLEVADVMTSDPICVDAGDSLADAMDAMIGGNFRHVPVLENGRITGVLSMREIPTEYRLMYERYLELRQFNVAAE